MGIDRNAEFRLMMQDKKLVKNLVSSIITVFEDCLPNAKWFVHAGTALGAYMDGQVLPGDHDIDVGVLAETCDVKNFSDAMAQCGFENFGYFHPANDENICFETWASKSGLYFNCSWLYLREWKVQSLDQILTVRKRWWLTSPKVLHVLPAYLFDNSEEVEFEGFLVPAPSPLRAYCDNRWPCIDGKYPGPEQGGERLEIIPEWGI